MIETIAVTAVLVAAIAAFSAARRARMRRRTSARDQFSGKMYPHW